jgi:hypothetical protein
MTFYSRFLCFLFFVTLCNSVQSQELLDFGLPTSDEIALKSCAFDPDADAVILKHEAHSGHDDERRLITSHLYRMKILKETGKRYATVVIPYFTGGDFESINELEAVVINTQPNGSLTKTVVDRKSFFYQKHDKDVSVIKFTFPAIQIGSIIEYRYKSTMKHYGGLRDWEFQSEIPVVRSKYALIIVPNAEFTYAVNKSDAYPIDIKQDPREGKVTFEMNNLPGLHDEPYMDARKDYLQQVNFQLSRYASDGQTFQKYMTTWEEVIRAVYNDSRFGQQLNKSLPGSDNFIKLAKMESDPVKRIKLVYNYVNSSIVWNGEKSRYSYDGVKEAWSKKSGNSGSINLILINLLQQADLDALPILVSERSNGVVNSKLPFVDQFNMVMAAVTIQGKTYYLNGIEQHCPITIIPSSILNTTGLLMKKRGGGLVEISDQSLSYSEIKNIMLQVSDGHLAGTLSMFALDYARVSQITDYHHSREDFLDAHFTKNNPGIVVDSFETMNESFDSLPFKTSFKFTIPVKESGEYTFIPLGNFSGFDGNPFLAEKRVSNINFGSRKSVTTTLFIDIPEGYAVDAVPKSTVLKTADNSIAISRQLIVDEANKRIQAKIQIQHGASWFSVEDYSTLRDFYKKMEAMLNEQIVLKKTM